MTKIIIAIEGPNFAGKTTMVEKLKELFIKNNISCTAIPEYVDLIGDENKQPDRPFKNKDEMKEEGDFYIGLEKKIQKMLISCNSEVIIRDRTFFTCLAYAMLSKNPVSEKMFKQYIDSKDYLHPNLIIFLDIDLTSLEYRQRLILRKKSNPKLRGLNYKIKEFSYIYRHKEYVDYFKNQIAKTFKDIVFVDPLKTDPNQVYDLIKRQKNGITKRAVIWPGYICNLNCVFCYNAGMKKNWREFEELKNEIYRDRFVYGNQNIDFMGGEPTLHPEIVRLVKYCSDIGIKPTLITNALMLADIHFLEKLKNAGINDFLVSVHGIGATADMIFNAGKKNYFQKQIQALDNLNQLKIPFRINTTLIKYNKKDLVQIAELAIQKGAKVVNFIMFNPHFAWSERKFIKFQDKYSHIRPYLAKAIDLLNKNKIAVNVRYFPFCQLKGDEKHVYNCGQLSYDEHEWDYNSWHNYKEKNPDKQWYYKKGIEQAKKNGSVKGQPCIGCALNKICDGFHSQYVLRYGFEEAKPYFGKLLTNPIHFMQNG